MVLTGRHREYGHADTCFPAWASGGNLYSPYMDGKEFSCMWCVVGPLVGFGMPRDYERIWTDTKLSPTNNLS
jgi:hypothetical protein